MSALGGMFSRAGGGVDVTLLQRLSSQMAQVGPDGEAIEVADDVGMLFRPFFTNDEARRSPRPTRDDEGFLITFDGWLDNHAELVSALRHDLEGRHQSVPEVVLAAFRRWGIQGFGRLVGEFAIALWNPKSQKLYLVSDALGFRPLYVAHDRDRILWASRALPLARLCGIEQSIDLDYLAAFLANNTTSVTPYRGLEVVPGGHVLTVSRSDIELRRYWDFDPAFEVRYTDDRDYEEHFRELFAEAVACRLPDRGPVFTELSGGVDSSSIACTVDRLLRRGDHGGNRQLHTLSYVFDGARSSDERPYIRQIEEAVDCRPHHLLEEEFSILSKRPPAGYCPDLPGNQLCYLARYDEVSRRLAAAGSRILLNGIGGDQAFISDDYRVPLELADMRVEGRSMGEVLRAGYRWSRVLRTPLLKTLWTGAIVPLSPFGQENEVLAPPEGEWLRSDFLDRHGLAERHPERDSGPTFELPSQRRQYWRLRDSMRLFALERHLTEGHFEVRYPYLDRRLLEFALAIPLSQKLRPKESRSIVRRALGDWMPASVLQRRTKAGPTEAFQRALVRERRWMDELFADPLLGQIGVLDPDAFRRTLHQARHGKIYLRSEMHRTVSLELWLRCLTGSPTDPQASGKVDWQKSSGRPSGDEDLASCPPWAGAGNPETPSNDGTSQGVAHVL